MANNKDFIVKNAVEVGGSTKVTVGDAAAGTVGPEGVFNTTLYTGTEASSQTITNGIDLSTDGGLVWVKARDSAINNFLMDTEQGVGKFLNSNQSYAQQTNSEGIKSFNTDGFTFGTQTGVGWSNDHVYWTFKKQSSFFDIVTWSGTGVANRVVSHSLNSTPAVILMKGLSDTYNWKVLYCDNPSSQSNFSGTLELNTNAAANTSSSRQTPFSTTNFQVTANGTTGWNESGSNYIAYLFAHDTSADSNIKCGSFTAGSSTETTVDLGWKPQWLMIKIVSTTGDWRILDSERGIGDGTYDYYLRANTADAETGPAAIADLTNTGFKVNYGGSDQDYVYIAIREGANTANLDLSTGNYFSHTPTSDLQYTFSNPADVQSFQLEVTGGAAGYDLSSAAYDSVELSVSAQEGSPNSIFFKPDGTKLFLMGDSGDDVNEYALSTAWDITSATFTTNFSVQSQETGPHGLWFKPDGTKMYVIGTSGDDVNEYDLSTAWDVSSASYSQNFSVNSQDTVPRAVTFKPDGTKMFMVGTLTDKIHEYTLSTAWDISTATYVDGTALTNGTNPHATVFNDDGTKLFTVNNGDNSVLEYSLTTAYDASTLSYVRSFSLSSQDTGPKGLFFKQDGYKMFVSGLQNDKVYQYSVATAPTITWSSAIQWAGGTAPDSPALGEKDVYTFMTDDTGTSYIGFQSGDAFS